MIDSGKNPDGTAFICAGEPSGDLYGAGLVDLIKKDRPELKFCGIGGPHLARSGFEVLEDYRELSLMAFGFSAGLAGLVRNYRAYRRIRRLLSAIKPDIFIAIAYPGVNLLLCRHAKKMGAQVYYALPPQIWAWGRFRKYFLKKWTDRVLSFLPFEHRFLKQLGICSTLMENPLLREAKKYRRKDQKKRIGLMPGSRPSMIKRNMPVITELIDVLKKTGAVADTEFVLILPPALNHCPFPFPLPDPNPFSISNGHYQSMRNCDLIITCSGTASLETAFMGIPQVFFHRPSFFDHNIARLFLPLKEYNLANLYFERKIVPAYLSRSVKDLVALLTRHLI